MSIKIFSFYNNKGGVGKTTLCSIASTLYAKNNPEKQILVIDMCPQANISQFLFGGGHKGYKTNQKLQSQATRKNIVGFIDWLLKGNANFTTPNTSYKIQVSRHNHYIPENLYLIAGDSFLESLSLALNYSVINPANTNAWKEYMTSIKRLCQHELLKKYEDMTVFIDCNPSFSIYTQMALVSSDYLIIPMMADFTSIEGIKSIMVMLYGQYPSAALKKYAQNIVTFIKQIEHFDLSLPVLFEFVFNNFTSNLGIANAYHSVKEELINFCYNQYEKFPGFFARLDNPAKSKKEWANIFVSDVKDFHTSGKVSATLGIPLFMLPEQTSYVMPDKTSVMLPKSNYSKALEDVERFVNKIS